MSASKTSGANARTDLAADLTADVFVRYFEAQFNTMRKDIEQHIIENDVVNEFTKEDLELAKTAVRLSASDGLSSGEDHVARIKSILSVG